MASLITSGVDYARFFDDLRAVIRQEVQQAISSTKATPEDENGGVELAMQELGLAKPTIYALVGKGLPYRKRGKKLYFNRAELRAWVAAGKRNEVAQ